MNPTFKLVSHKLCPYVQRSAITLEEKNIAYERVDIDLDNPPQWFLDISPLGKVPLLIVDDQHVLFESAVITEYLNEVTEGSVHSEDPLVKANHRAWIEFGSNILDHIGGLYSAQDKNTYQEKKQTIRTKLTQLEAAHSGNSYFGGNQFMLVDAVYATIFRYLSVFEKHIDFNIDAGLNKIQHWRTQLKNRASVKTAVPLNYEQLLLEFIKQRGSYMSSLIQ